MRLHFSITHWDADRQTAAILRDAIELNYPGSSIALVPDGVGGLGRLKNIDGGAWIERIMRSFPPDFDRYFKIEPDVQILRAAAEFPDDDWLGYVRYHHEMKRLINFGGLWGFSRDAIDRVLQSGLLRNEKYLSRDWTYDRYGKFLLPGELPAPALYCCDHIMADVMAQLKMIPQQWDAVHLTFREHQREPIKDIGSIAFFN